MLVLAFSGAVLCAAPDIQTVEVRAAREPRSLVIPTVSEARARIQKTPGGVDVIDTRQVKSGRATVPQDLLGYSPGLFVQQRDTAAQESRVSIRGSGLQRTFHLRGIKILQDGIPLNQADGGGDMQRIEPLTTQYTEVFRGGNALRYGATTLGGAVNLVSRTGHDAAPLQFWFSRGSFATLHSQLSTGGTDGTFDHYVSGSQFKQDGFRQHSRQDNEYLFTNVGWRIDPEWETRLYFTREIAKAELAGSLTKAQSLADPTQARLGNVVGDNKRDFDYFRVASKTTWRRGHHRVDLSAYTFGIDLFHPIFQVLDIDSHDVGGEVRYTSTAPVAGRANTLTLGLAPAIGTNQEDRFVNVRGRPGARTAQFDQRATNLDFFAENHHQLTGRLALVPGVQISRAVRRNTDFFFANGDDSGRTEYSAVNPKLGATYDLGGLQAFGGYTRAFEPPTFPELFDQAGDFLANQAQAADTFEVGVRDAHVDLTLYEARVKNELLGLVDATGNPLGTVNSRVPTTHRGAELGWNAPLAGRLQLRGIYNWNHLRFRDDSVFRNNQLPSLPEHFARAELTYQHPSGLHAGPSVERVFSKYAVDFANTLFADPYTNWGLRVGCRGPRWSGFLDGKNLSNRVYTASTGVVADARGADSNQVFNPGNGRAWYGGLECRF